MGLVLALGLLAVAVAIWEVSRALRSRPVESEQLLRVKSLQIGEGDVVVLLYRGGMSAGMYEVLVAHVGKVLPGHKVLVLDRGLDIEILHRDQVPKDQAKDGNQEASLTP